RALLPRASEPPRRTAGIRTRALCGALLCRASRRDSAGRAWTRRWRALRVPACRVDRHARGGRVKAPLLVVDDDPGLRRALSDRMQHWGHAVTEAADRAGALAAARQGMHDLVLLDLSLPDGSGLDVLRELRKDGSSADIVVLTAHGSIESAVEA